MIIAYTIFNKNFNHVLLQFASGIGVITHFWSRVVQNPSKTKKFTNFKFTTDSDAEQASDILMKWQGFYFDDPNGTRVGGEASCSTISCTFGGVFCK